tara:strand:- start:78835 stop:80220 length:1386 start_codon:yes stop_codon:yes gene_type:complete
MHQSNNLILQKIAKDPFCESFCSNLHNLLESDTKQKLLIAVSGGMDSMAMFFAIKSLKCFDFVIGHVDHALRNESVDDLKFVESIARKFEVPFFYRTLKPKNIKYGVSIESWCRKNRYYQLDKIAKYAGAYYTLTAHHANDQAETVLLNLSRHSGVSGLCGIGMKNKNLIRPLLFFSKREIKAFVKKHQIPYVIDRTNDDVNIPRNFIRKKILNEWEEVNGDMINAINQSAEHFSEWKSSLDFFIRKILLKKIGYTNDGFEIPINLIQQTPVFSIVRLIQFLTSDEKDLWSKDDLNRIKLFLKTLKTGKKIVLRNKWELLADRKSIYGGKKIFKNMKKKIKLDINKNTYFFNRKYKLSLVENYFLNDNSKNTEYVNWYVLKNMKLELRLWRNGDVFQPLGMNGHQKVSDFLINRKVNQFDKMRQTVMTANGEIFWVCGYRISEWAKITKKTNRAIKLQYVN